MNRIYKVIWSKVKHQYVVVSELAHRDGKRSVSTSKSVRIMLSVLAVCGMTAFSNVSFADVGQAVEAQYVAFEVDGTNNSDRDSRTFTLNGQRYTYNKQTLTVDGKPKTYWVRDGYTLDQTSEKRFPGASTSTQLIAIKSPDASTDGLLQSTQVVVSTPGQSTVLGSTLEKLDAALYLGGSNTSSVDTPSSYNYWIKKDDGSYVDAGGDNFDTYFVEAVERTDGTYTVNGEVVSKDNLYVINDKYTTGWGPWKQEHDDYKIGAFVVDGHVYTGSVFGQNNEIVMSAQQNGIDYSMWSFKSENDDMPMELTQGDYKKLLTSIWNNDTKLSSADVAEIKISETVQSGQNGGTISFIQQGTYNEETGKYAYDTNVPGTIQISSIGGTGGIGDDVKVQFSNDWTDKEGVRHSGSFTVDAGSKVVGKNGDAVANEGETLTSVDINGKNYLLGGGKTYDQGVGIAINDDTISVDLADNGGLHFDGNKLANNLKVTVDPNATKDNLNGGNWTVTDTAQSGLKFTNTTLFSTVDKKPIADNAYGNTYTVSDTDGNKAVLEDVASANKLKEVAGEAGKHTTVTGSEHITVTPDEDTSNGLHYTITANGLADINLTNITDGGKTVIKDIAKGADIHIKADSYTVQDGTVTLNYVNGNGEDVEGSATITGLATATDVDKAKTTVSEDNNVTVTPNDQTEDGHTDYKVSLKNDIYLGGSQTAENNNLFLDGTNGSIYVGASSGDRVVINGTDRTISGLSNTTWTPTTVDYSQSNKAATEAQLQTVSNEAGKHTTVEGSDHITVTPDEDTSNGLHYTITANGLADINLTNITDGGKTVIKDIAKGADIHIKADSYTVEDGTVTLNYVNGNGEDVEGSATITGLATATDVDKAKTTVSEGNNVTVTPNDQTEDGHMDYKVSLKDDIYLGGSQTAENNNLFLDGTNGSIYVGASSGDRVVINGTDRTISGLSNTTWTPTTVDYSQSNKAATEAQLQTVSNEAGKHTTVEGSDHITVTPDEDTSNGLHYTITANGLADIDLTNITDGGKTVIKDIAKGADIHIKEGSYTVEDGTVTLNYVNGNGEDVEGSATITGLATATDVDKAKTTVSEGNNVTVTPNDQTEDGHMDYKVSLKDDIYLGGSQTAENNKLFLDGTNGSIYVGASSGNRVVINGADRTISGLSNITWTPTTVDYSQSNKAATEAQLSQAISNATSEMIASDQHLVANPDGGNYAVNKETGDVTLKVQYKDEQGNTKYHDVTIEDVASKTNLDALESIVGDGNYIKPGETGNVVNNDMNVTEAIGALDGAIANATANANKHSSVHGGSNISVTEGTNPDFEGGKDYVVSLNDHITLGDKEQGTYVDVNGENGTVTASGNISAGSFKTDNITIDGIGADGKHTGTITGLSNTTWNKDVADAVAADTTGTGAASVAATQGQLKTATEGMVQYDRNEDDGSVDKGSITFAGENGTTLKNVAAGEVSATSTQAVNGSQLWQTNQAVINNSNNIQMLSNSVNKLDNRIDRVGAGAAALAALHPLDFDPDAKWDFAAGYGNYRGANAVAVGAYYRPNEDVMFSVGGSMGGGENMVNAGVSLKIGAGSSNVTTSRVAMAKEIKSMRDIVAKQDAQIQKLTAMVNALVGVQTETDSSMFPDVPENHWAYEAVEAMAKSGLVKGYPDGEFKGDRTMTRYEFAQIVYNAIQAGAEVDARLVEEFKPELQFFHIATVAKDKDGNPTIERVRAN